MKIYLKQTLVLLKDKNNFLVRFDSYDGIIRNKYEGEKGELSQKIIDKLINRGKIVFISNGRGLLNHEKYYKLKND